MHVLPVLGNSELIFVLFLACVLSMGRPLAWAESITCFQKHSHSSGSTATDRDCCLRRSVCTFFISFPVVLQRPRPYDGCMRGAWGYHSANILFVLLFYVDEKLVRGIAVAVKA